MPSFWEWALSLRSMASVLITFAPHPNSFSSRNNHSTLSSHIYVEIISGPIVSYIYFHYCKKRFTVILFLQKLYILTRTYHPSWQEFWSIFIGRCKVGRKPSSKSFPAIGSTSKCWSWIRQKRSCVRSSALNRRGRGDDPAAAGRARGNVILFCWIMS